MVDGIESDVVLFGISGFRVRGVVESDGELWIGVETTVEITGCPDCGSRAKSKGRRTTVVRDLPVGGRPGETCLAETPSVVSRPGLRSGFLVGDPPRDQTTSRAHRTDPPLGVCEVGEKGRTVASVAADLGVGWHAVMDTVREQGEPLVEKLSLQG